MTDASLYRRMWEIPGYRVTSPGENVVPQFLWQAEPKAGTAVLDLGCGTGRAGLALSKAGLDVTLVDWADNCRDEEAKGLRFLCHDLRQPLPVVAPLGFCADVLEHVAPEDVDRVLRNCLQAARYLYLRICCVADRWGVHVGQQLHLTQQPYAWWREKLTALGATVIWSEDKGDGFCSFYVTAWKQAADLTKDGKLNVTEDLIRANVRANLQANWQEVEPHEPQPDAEVMILGGGPSLGRMEWQIRKRREAGAKLVTLNGAYNWCLERGLTPSAQIVVDARPFNARFTKPVVENCRYLIASQVDPSVFEGLPRERTWLWHTAAESIADVVGECRESWWGIPGGSTVLLRALPLLQTLGYSKFHLYGCDSCLSGRKHHAFAQPENDCPAILPVEVGGRTFWCHWWMMAQAAQWIELLRVMKDHIQVAVHGGGLLQHILKTAAAIQEAKDEREGTDRSPGGLPAGLRRVSAGKQRGGQHRGERAEDGAGPCACAYRAREAA